VHILAVMTISLYSAPQELIFTMCQAENWGEGFTELYLWGPKNSGS